MRLGCLGSVNHHSQSLGFWLFFLQALCYNAPCISSAHTLGRDLQVFRKNRPLVGGFLFYVPLSLISVFEQMLIYPSLYRGGRGEKTYSEINK